MQNNCCCCSSPSLEASRWPITSMTAQPSAPRKKQAPRFEDSERPSLLLSWCKKHAKKQQLSLRQLMQRYVTAGEMGAEDSEHARTELPGALLSKMAKRLEWCRSNIHYTQRHGTNFSAGKHPWSSDAGAREARNLMESLWLFTRKHQQAALAEDARQPSSTPHGRERHHPQHHQLQNCNQPTRRRPGLLQCAYQDSETPTCVLRRPKRISQWEPARVAPQPPDQFLPARAAPYWPQQANQRRQWRKVQGWQLDRLQRRVTFSIGAMDKAVRTWRAGCPAERTGAPPLHVLRKAAWINSVPTACASESGHLWTQEGPLDVAQLAATLSTPIAAAASLEILHLGLLSESVLRGLHGQATAQSALLVAIERLNERAEGALFASKVSLGALGAGMGFSVTQAMLTCEEKGTGATIVWAREDCPLAILAFRVLMKHVGQSVEAAGRAEEPLEEGSRAMGEIGTLRCAPLSQARAGNSAGVEAALTELAAVTRACAARCPNFIIFETTSGLWRHPTIRRRYEGVLQAMKGYEWEAIRTSPLIHGGVGVNRDRVLYCGLRPTNASDWNSA